MTDGSRSSAEADAPPGARAGLSEAILAAIETHLRQRELRRDELSQQARRLRRLSQATMNRLHVERRVPAEIAAVRTALLELAGRLRQDARGDEPLALDALQEAVEASLLGAIVEGAPLPGPGELGVEPEPYLLGVGDVVGEIRRLVLDRLGHEDLTSAESYLLLMEELTWSLLRFDTTRAIVQLKPKQDAARALLERTRGDVVMARFLSRLPRPGAAP